MNHRRTSRGWTQQTDLTNFTTPTTKAKLTANNQTMEASVTACPVASAGPEKQPEENTTTVREESSSSLTTILAAINTMKTEVLSKFDDIMAVIKNVRRDITDCSERLTQAETTISTTEDDVTTLREKVKILEEKNKERKCWTWKLVHIAPMYGWLIYLRAGRVKTPVDSWRAGYWRCWS